MVFGMVMDKKLLTSLASALFPVVCGLIPTILTLTDIKDPLLCGLVSHLPESLLRAPFSSQYYTAPGICYHVITNCEEK